MRPEQNASRSGNRQSSPRLQTQDQTYRMFLLFKKKKFSLLHRHFIMTFFHILFQWVSIPVPLKVQHFTILLSLINVTSILESLHCLAMPHGDLSRQICHQRHWPKSTGNREPATCRHVGGLQYLYQTSVNTGQAEDRGRRKPSQRLWYRNTKFHALKRTWFSSLLGHLGEVSMK